MPNWNENYNGFSWSKSFQADIKDFYCQAERLITYRELSGFFRRLYIFWFVGGRFHPWFLDGYAYLSWEFWELVKNALFI